jgi:hypothetical protein
VNRTFIRGITAGIFGSILTASAVVVGPTIARGAETTPDYGKALPAAEQHAAVRWDLPKVSYLRHVHPTRQQEPRASRSTYRAPLTGSPQTVAHAMVLRRGWSESEWNCLNTLWTRESGWNTYATNSSSGAYGIPQALPATKMASAGADYRTNPVTQITWGLGYIATTYGTPCAALSHSSSTGYY